MADVATAESEPPRRARGGRGGRGGRSRADKSDKPDKSDKSNKASVVGPQPSTVGSETNEATNEETAGAMPPPAPVATGRTSKPTKKSTGKHAESEAATTEPHDTPSGDRKNAIKKEPKKKPGARRSERRDDEADEEEAEAVDWSTAAWFSGCDADLGTGYWLLTRCYACTDVAVLASEALVRRAVLLQKLHARLKTELLPQDEHDDEAEHHHHDEPKPKRQEWSATEILDALVAALPAPPRAEGNSQKTPDSRSVVVASLEGEVVDVATELLVGRIGREGLELLERWEAHLASLLPEPMAADSKAATDAEGAGGDAAEASVSDDDDDDDAPGVGDTGVVDDSDPSAPKKAEDSIATGTGTDPAVVLPPPRQRRRRGAGAANSAIAHAKAQVTAAIAFHRSYENQVQTAGSTVDSSVSAQSVARWTQEVTAVYETTRVTAADEAKRKGVAAQIETAFRRSSSWRHHEVLLFGSSLSKFGSKSSDLDLCLRATNVDPEETNAIMSVRELKLRMRRAQHQQDSSLPTGDVTSRNDDAPFLKELLDKSLKTVEALANTVKKQRKKTATKSDAKLQRLALLLAHWRAIVVALEFFHDKLISGGVEVHETASATSQREAKAAAAAYHAAVHKQQKKRQREIYAASALLSRNGCDVDLVVAHARVPVIGFTHKASGFECDLCFDNYHACINTLLLRTYAEYDDRARLLGMAIKHWAKRRGINDASQGFLSSYSFILLVIYFLQHKARLLPNLQDPELLRQANVEPMKLNGVDVSFCGTVAKAKAFHAARLETQTTAASSDATSVGSLLAAFYRFYVEEFDFSQHVVSVRHPETPMSKRTRWGRNKLKAWRFSIEDPLELDRDLGSVLQFRCQQRIVEELKRALELLRNNQSFEAAVCEADPSAKKNESVKKDANKKGKKEPQQKKGGAQADKKESHRDEKAGGDRKKATPAKATKSTARAKDGAVDAPHQDDKKPVSSRESRTDRNPSREKPAPADATASNAGTNNQQSGRPSRERSSHEKGGRRRPRHDGAKPKDDGLPKSTPA